MTVLQSQLSVDTLQARIAELEAKLAAAKRPSKLTLKVSEKGALSAYGLGRWPVTLYRGQWERLLASADEVRNFIEVHADQLSVKD